MSFTADELQAFNDILDRKLSAHRRDMERLFDQRLNAFRREVDRRLIAVQQEVIRVLTQKLNEQEGGAATMLQQELTDAQIRVAQMVKQEVKQGERQQTPDAEQIAGIVDRSLAAQLLAIEELLNQRILYTSPDEVALSMAAGEQMPQFEAIELQTELPWEDLMEVFGKALDDRFNALASRAQTAIQHLEREFSSRISALQHSLFDESPARHMQPYENSLTGVQEVYQSIEQLERMVEAMQVAMTANHAMLSNRLFHHQQLSSERAHPSHPIAASDNSEALQHSNGMSNFLPHGAKDHHEPPAADER